MQWRLVILATLGLLLWPTVGCKRQPPSVAELIKRYQAERDWDKKDQIALKIAARGPEARPELLQALQSSDRFRRLAAVGILAMTPEKFEGVDVIAHLRKYPMKEETASRMMLIAIFNHKNSVADKLVPIVMKDPSPPSNLVQRAYGYDPERVRQIVREKQASPDALRQLQAVMEREEKERSRRAR